MQQTLQFAVSYAMRGPATQGQACKEYNQLSNTIIRTAKITNYGIADRMAIVEVAYLKLRNLAGQLGSR